MDRVFLGRWRVRDYRVEDLVRLHEIDRICFPTGIAFSRNELSCYLDHPDSITRIAERDESVVGFAVGRILGNDSAHVITLDVMPQARRHGIGTGLMAVLHEEFKRQGVLWAFLEVRAADRGALSFYERLNYRYVETVRGYYSRCDDAFRMICHLAGTPVNPASPDIPCGW